MEETEKHSKWDEPASPRLKCIFRIVVVLCVIVFAAEIGYLIVSHRQMQAELNERLYVAFYTNQDETYSVRSDWEELDDYRSEYDFNSRIYYGKLSKDAQRVYHFFEYAFDNRYSHILIDVRLIPQDVEMEQILHYLMLDSGMIEQNLSRGERVQANELVYDGLIEYRVDVEMHHVYVPGFEQEYFDKKIEALTVAKQVVAEMPAGFTDAEKARYFFDYLGNRVVYKDAENDGSRHYLYEALCEHHTNCDGFANAYSLLCQLGGIPCFEKVYWGEESGHTWNSVQLDGVWYNVDATSSPNITNEGWTATLRFRFGYSDSRQKNTPHYADILPVCDGEMQPATLHFASPSDATAHTKLWQAIKNSKQPILMALDTADKAQIKALMQTVCDTYGCSVSHLPYESPNGWFVYVLRTA